jgi:hypothetical protein
MTDSVEEAAQRAIIEGALTSVVHGVVVSTTDMLVALANTAASDGASTEFVRGVAFAAEAVRALQ